MGHVGTPREVPKSGILDVQSMAATVLAQYGDRRLSVLKPIQTGLEVEPSLWAVRIGAIFAAGNG
jgi:hypothetical protein